VAGRAAGAIRAVVLAEALLEAVEAAAADRVVAGLAAAAVRVVVAGRAGAEEAAERFRRIPLTPRSSSPK
jgi:hypothetical protein